MLILALTLLLSIIVSCDPIEEGWKGIRPFKTNRTTVDKILGKPEESSPGYFNYRAPDSFVHMTYSTGACLEDQLGRGEYNVPKDTVLRYNVHIKKAFKLADLRFNVERYKKSADPELLERSYYYNDVDGVEISTIKADGIEYVARISFELSKAEKKSLECKSLKPAN